MIEFTEQISDKITLQRQVQSSPDSSTPQTPGKKENSQYQINLKFEEKLQENTRTIHDYNMKNEDIFEPKLNESYKIFVKTFTGNTVAIDVNMESSIRDVLVKVHEIFFPISTHFERIMFGGKTLQGNKKLKDYNIHSNSTLETQLVLRGGMKRVVQKVGFSNKLIKNSLLNYLSKLPNTLFKFMLVQPYHIYDSHHFITKVKSVKRGFCSGNQSSKYDQKINENALQEAFRYTFKEDLKTCFILDAPVIKPPVPFKNKMYFQNRTNIMLSVANKIYDNYTNKENEFTKVERTKLELIACTQGNGIGKTTFLKMIEYFIPYIMNDEKKIKLNYTKTYDFKFVNNSVLESFISAVLMSIKLILKIDYDIKNNLSYSNSILENLALRLHSYLSSDSSNEEKKNSFYGLLSYYDCDTKNIEYQSPPEGILVFRFDEIGNITPKNDLKTKSKLEAKFKNLGYDDSDISKYIGLYELRNYISTFTSFNTLEVIVAGKDSFLPFMGNLEESASPCKIYHVNLNPLTKIPTEEKKEQHIYIKRIVQYFLMSKDSELKTNLLIVRKTMNETDFEDLMMLFYKMISEYTGGHPRILKITIDELGDYVNSNLYFTADKLSQVQKLDTLFKNLYSKFVSKNNADFVLDKFNNNTFIRNFYSMIGLPFLKNNQIMHVLQSLSNINSMSIIAFLNNLVTIYNLKIKSEAIHNINKLISIEDILISISIPYKLTIPDPLLPDNLFVQLFYPKFVEIYNDKQFGEMKKSDKTLLALKLRPFLKATPLDVENYIIVKYGMVLLRNIEYELKSWFGSSEFSYSDVVYVPIKGFVYPYDKRSEISKVIDDEKTKIKINEYSKSISSQIEFLIRSNLNSENKLDKVLLLDPETLKNFAHDLIAVVPGISDIIYLFTIQIKDIVENTINSSDLYNGLESLKLISTMLEDKISKVAFSKNKYFVKGKFILACTKNQKKSRVESDELKSRRINLSKKDILLNDKQVYIVNPEIVNEAIPNTSNLNPIEAKFKFLSDFKEDILKSSKNSN